MLSGMLDIRRDMLSSPACGDENARLGPEMHSELGDATVRISSDARRSVVFFGKPSSPAGEVKYSGTGFLLCDAEEGENLPYVVTCRHVARQLEGEFIVRVNKHGEGSIKLEISNIKWRYHPDVSVDLAAAVLPLDAKIYDVGFMNTRLIQPYVEGRTMCGDPIALIGLFRLHAGTKRNVPIVHSGNIAALPDPQEKLPLRDRITDQSWAIRWKHKRWKGLSGSPVFIAQFGVFPGLKTPQGGLVGTYSDYRILGLYQGAWDGEPGTILAADKNLTGNLRVPVGMGIVIPGERIIELINEDSEFKSAREFQRRSRLRISAAMTDATPFPFIEKTKGNYQVDIPNHMM